MYNGSPLIAAGIGAGALAVTGLSAIWLFLAAFALLAAGAALLRTLPRSEG